MTDRADFGSTTRTFVDGRDACVATTLLPSGSRSQQGCRSTSGAPSWSLPPPTAHGQGQVRLPDIVQFHAWRSTGWANTAIIETAMRTQRQRNSPLGMQRATDRERDTPTGAKQVVAIQVGSHADAAGRVVDSVTDSVTP